MPLRNVQVTEHLDAFITQGVISGRFIDADKAVEEALSLLQQREADNQAKLEWLRAATQQALQQIDSGESLHFESMEDATAYVHQIGDDVAAAEPRQ